MNTSSDDAWEYDDENKSDMNTGDNDNDNDDNDASKLPKPPKHFIVYLVLVFLSLIMFSLLVTFNCRFPFWKEKIRWSPWWINLIQGSSSSSKGFNKYTPSQANDPKLTWKELEEDFTNCNSEQYATGKEVGPKGVPPCIRNQSMQDSALGESHYNCAGASRELPNIGTFTLKTWKGITAQLVGNTMD